MSRSFRRIDRVCARSKHPLTAVDLFSGCGGLTGGLRAAGFAVLAAVEKDADTAASYTANHPGVRLYETDIRRLPASRLIQDLPALQKSRLDLIAGCPPCQGFTRLTERHSWDDPRNQLVREYLRFVRVLRPRACMLENVPGLLTRGKELFDELRSGLEAAGYFLTYEVLELADYGVPQFRKRLVLLASADNPIEIPPPTHCDPASGKNQRHWRTVRHAVGSMLQPPLRSEVRSGAVLPPYPWHVARNVAPDVRRRLEHALRSDKGRADLPEELRLACHKRYPNGYFDVYGAMSWDSPSPTITSGCTNASKGRFGHPSFPRPLTAREAAKLQTFPLDYRFEGPGVDSVAVQIGNALPKRFATVIGRAVAAHLADPQRATTTEIQGRRRVT